MKITDKVHAIKHTFLIPVNPVLKIKRFVYSFIIFGKENVYLIDSGVKDSAETILNYIVENDRTTNKINTLILTHSHPDHIGSAKIIKEKTSCDIIAHSNEKDWIEDIEKQFAERPVPGFKSFVNDSVKIDKFIQDGDMVELEERIFLKVIYTPGHSNGSVSLFFEDEGVLMCGDCLLLPGNLPIYENAVQAVSSINKLRQIDNVKILLSSWDEPVLGDEIAEKMDQSISYFKSIHKVIAKIENISMLTPMELCKQVIEKMGLTPLAVNPLVAKSLLSNIAILGNKLLK